MDVHDWDVPCLRVQALTAEVNMRMTESQADKSEISRQRKEIYDLKTKYNDCRRKVVTQAQYAAFYFC